MFIFRTISQPQTLSADIPAAGWGLFTNYQHNIMTKQNHICSFLTLLFLKSLCQSSIFTQHKILTYWKQKHPSLLSLPTKFPWSCNHNNYYYLALINRTGGLYGRILTEVCTHDRGQDSPIQTDLARLIRCLLYGENKNNLLCLM